MSNELAAALKERDEYKRQAELWQQRYERLLKDIEDELQKDQERQTFGNLLLMGLNAIYKRETGKIGITGR